MEIHQASFCECNCDPNDPEYPHWEECEEMREMIQQAKKITTGIPEEAA